MKPALTGFSRGYLAELRKHLGQSPQSARPRAASELGVRAMKLGLETLDLARIHEGALILLAVPGDSPADREATVRRAGAFFAEAITPIEKTHRIAHEANARLNDMIRTLDRRSADLTASNRLLRREIVQRKSAETSFRRSEQHYGRLLEQSRNMQEQMRQLSRQLLSAQEEERKAISRELHDVIAQTLTGINVRLANLKKEALGNRTSLDRNIARTQQLVEQAVEIVHRFARELRPTVLDDLGLIPALHTFMKSFREHTGIRTSLSAFSAVEQLSGHKRTVLYRVAQEALNNVSRHAQARRVHVSIREREGNISMRIRDDGKGFVAPRVIPENGNKRLGLLGMRERLDMVGGQFLVTSAPGMGTTVLVRIPLADKPSPAQPTSVSRLPL